MQQYAYLKHKKAEDSFNESIIALEKKIAGAPLHAIELYIVALKRYITKHFIYDYNAFSHYSNTNDSSQKTVQKILYATEQVCLAPLRNNSERALFKKSVYDLVYKKILPETQGSHEHKTLNSA